MRPNHKIKINVMCFVAPRLEVFFLEEWIQHYKLLGIDRVVFINNGIKPLHKDIVTEGDRWHWRKKPYLDYNWEYSDQDIEDKYLEIVKKYDVISVDQSKRYSNAGFFGKLISRLNLDNDYWLFIDPDEYLLPRKHVDLISFLKDKENEGYDAFVFNQKVFDVREKNKRVIDVINCNREMTDYKSGLVKSLVKNDIAEFSIHESKPKSGEIVKVKNDVMIYHHYRGPFVEGDIQEFEERRKLFKNIDRSMLEYYQRREGCLI